MIRWTYTWILMTCILLANSSYMEKKKVTECNVGDTKCKTRDSSNSLSWPDAYNPVDSYQITLNNGTVSFCGGTIIALSYVLTAAHCVFHARGPIKGPIHILLGLTRYNTTRPSIATVKRISIPSVYYGYRGAFQAGDICMLELDRQLYRHHQFIQIARLPVLDPVTYHCSSYEDKVVTLFVPKVVYSKGVFEKKVLLRHGRVLNHEHCQSAWNEMEISTSQMCVELTTAMANGVCPGESGSGAMYGEDTVIGVASYGPEINSWRFNQPGVYTRVSHWLWFIESILRNESVGGICSYRVQNIYTRPEEKKNIPWVLILSILSAIIVIATPFAYYYRRTIAERARSNWVIFNYNLHRARDSIHLYRRELL